jgi:hypothetical protein
VDGAVFMIQCLIFDLEGFALWNVPYYTSLIQPGMTVTQAAKHTAYLSHCTIERNYFWSFFFQLYDIDVKVRCTILTVDDIQTVF